MKTMFAKKLLLASAFVICLTAQVQAQTYSPQALKLVIEKAQAIKDRGSHAVVMFDLDDTLINTKERNLRVFKDFANLAEIQAQYPEESAKVENLLLNQIHFLSSETFKEIGVVNPDFIKAISDFWLTKFFSNEYCAMDKQNLGAAKYLYELTQAGAIIVYLTGRDAPRMGQGTQENLIRNGFPVNPDQAVLIMKPDQKQDDLEFKKSQFADIANMGEVIGVFENEPANINAMAQAFPQATAIFLDTIHSPTTEVPQPGVFLVRDFRHMQ